MKDLPGTSTDAIEGGPLSHYGEAEPLATSPSESYVEARL